VIRDGGGAVSRIDWPNGLSGAKVSEAVHMIEDWEFKGSENAVDLVLKLFPILNARHKSK
jgi:hypothetical protein